MSKFSLLVIVFVYSLPSKLTIICKFLFIYMPTLYGNNLESESFGVEKIEVRLPFGRFIGVVYTA